MAESSNTAPPRKRGVWEWFWRGSELAQAREQLQRVPQSQRLLLKRAETALELAGRAFDPIDALRSGPSLPLAVSLYREAAYWALCAQGTEPRPSDNEAAFASVDGAILLALAGGEEALQQLRTSFVTKSFRQTADDTAEVQRAEASALRTFTQALIQRQLGAERRVGRALVRRWVRVSLTMLALLILALSSTWIHRMVTQGPDLAAGKPRRASSVSSTWAPQPGNYEFVTNEEDSPWLEIDLQAPTQFSVVEVINRRDCCQERVLPTVIEISSDRTHWKEVSRRTEAYTSWRATFAPRRARYVRVRVARHSTLHLAGVAVRGR